MNIRAKIFDLKIDCKDQYYISSKCTYERGSSLREKSDHEFNDPFHKSSRRSIFISIVSNRYKYRGGVGYIRSLVRKDEIRNMKNKKVNEKNHVTLRDINRKDRK